MARPNPSTRYAMAKYPGNGSQTDFGINFVGGWLHPEDLYAYGTLNSDENVSVDYSLAIISSSSSNGVTSGVVRVTPAPATGYTVHIVRLTQRANPLVDFVNKALLTPENLNTITEQAIYSVAELEDSFRELSLGLDDFKEGINESFNEFKQEVNTSITSIAGIANTANQTAANALTVANAATSAASAAQHSADQANQTANSAVTIANSAVAGVASAQNAAEVATAAANNATAAANAATDATNKVSEQIQGTITSVNQAVDTANAASAAANAVSDKADQAAVDAANAANSAAQAVDAANAATTAANSKVSRAGDTMTGPLVFTGSDALDVRRTANRLMVRDDAGKATIDAITTDGAAWDVLRFRGTGMLFNNQQVWYTGNFNPDSKANLSSPIFTGTPRVTGSGYFQIDDGGSNSVRFGWNADMSINGGAYYKIWHAGNFDPGNKAALNSSNPGGNADANNMVSGFRGFTLNDPSTNTPDNSWTSVIQAMDSGGGWGFQISHPWFQDELYYRQNNNRTFGGWRRLWHNGNFNPDSKANLSGASFTGKIYAAAGVQYTSDKRAKKELLYLSDSRVESFRSIPTYTGRYKKKFSPDQARKLFVLAQDLERLLPEVVSKDEHGYLSVDYGQLAVAALALAEAAHDKIDELENRIVTLEDNL